MNNKKKIFDNHVHTCYGYCAEKNMLPSSSIEIAEQVDYGICLVEHTGQLYVGSEDFWTGNFVNYPEIIHDSDADRMDEYIGFITDYRSDNVKTGMEVDLDKNGNLTILDKHKDCWDILIGAVHFFPKYFKDDMESGFMWAVERYANSDVDILAHPFRTLRHKGFNVGKRLYKQVVDLLRDKNIAVEINYHNNEPDADFFKMCLDNDIKISFGSDSHSLYEVCRLQQHIILLESIAGEKNLDNIIFKHKDLDRIQHIFHIK